MPAFYIFQSLRGTLSILCPHTYEFRPVASEWLIESISDPESLKPVRESAGALAHVVSEVWTDPTQVARRDLSHCFVYSGPLSLLGHHSSRCGSRIQVVTRNAPLWGRQCGVRTERTHGRMTNASSVPRF